MPANTKSLCHFNGDNLATSVSDAIGGVTWDLYPGIGEYYLITSDFKFGSACLGGDFGCAGEASGISCPASGSWTVEGFGKSANVVDDTRISWRNSGGAVRGYLGLRPGTGELIWEVLDSAGNPLHTNAVGASISANTWYHYAVVREGTTYSLYFNGSRIDSFTSATNTADIAGLEIVSGNGGRVDEIRVSNSARYSGSTYTVPTAEFISLLIEVPLDGEAFTAEQGVLSAWFLGNASLSLSGAAGLAASELTGSATLSFSGTAAQAVQGFAGEVNLSLSGTGDMVRPDPRQFGMRVDWVDILAEPSYVHALAKASAQDIEAEPSQ